MPRWVHPGVAGLRRYCSTYLLSAFLVLFGTYLRLYQDGGHRTVELGKVLTTHLLYQLGLVLVIGLLHRGRREVRDTVVLTTILGVFLGDGLLTQQLYDWVNGDGLHAAMVGAGFGLVLLLATALLLGLSLTSRLVLTSASVILFVRFGAAVMIGAPEPVFITPRYLAAGYLLAACLLPALLGRPTDRGGARLPLQAMERWGIGGALALGLAHFAMMGRAFDRPFLLDYLAPFVILLGPVLERVVPEIREVRAGRLLTSGLPFAGLMLAARHFPPALFGAASDELVRLGATPTLQTRFAEWAYHWPLTPFYFALVLTAAVQLYRSLHHPTVYLRPVAVLLAAMACLGGDFPQILFNARFPAGWQVLAVAAILWAAILRARHVPGGLILQAAPAFVLAGWLSGYDYPLWAGYGLGLAAGALVIEARIGWAIPRWPRLAVVTILTLLPVLVLLQKIDVPARMAVAATAIVGLAIAGAVGRDRLLWQVPAASALVAVVGLPLVFQLRGDISAGVIVTQLGFYLLAVGFLNSTVGGWMREQWQTWWHDGARPKRAAPVDRSVAS